MHRRGEISFAGVHAINLDEYVGPEPGAPSEFCRRSWRSTSSAGSTFPRKIGISPTAPRPIRFKRRSDIEKLYWEIGPVDAQVLGIGSNGHIGFNEPGTPFDSTTQVVELAEATRHRQRGARSAPPKRSPSSRSPWASATSWPPGRSSCSRRAPPKPKRSAARSRRRPTPEVPASVLANASQGHRLRSTGGRPSFSDGRLADPTEPQAIWTRPRCQKPLTARRLFLCLGYA